MGHNSCCVINCTNTGRNSNCKFYSFPTAKWKLEQRKKWIIAVKRKNPDGTPWYPKRSDHICSAHFIGGKKSEAQLSPSYVPTIFPPIYKASKVNESTILNRHERFMERRFQTENVTTSVSSENSILFPKKNGNVMKIDDADDSVYSANVKNNQACQVNIFFNSVETGETFVCNRYVYNNKCDAEIQTSITDCTESKSTNSMKKLSEKCCGTENKIPIDKCVATDNKCFYGFRSIRKDEQLVELAGVTFNNFEFLLKKMSSLNKCTLSKEDRLFIFLMKIKTGLTFSTLSILFDVHRTTISRIFHATLQNLVLETKNLIFWPSSEAVKSTMPAFFRPNYVNTRVIIDCVEFKVEVPTNIDNCLYCCSNNEKAFTAKVLVGATPGGFFCFKSKAIGGRNTNSQLITESGLIDKLENGDVVLTGKEFVGIKAAIDQSKKQVSVTTSTLVENKAECSKLEAKRLNNSAKVQIHVEKIIERLKLYKILDKIPENLFNCMDDIIHTCCVLTNLHQEK